MKATFVLIAVLAVLAVAQGDKNDFEMEFFQGMESGFFLRDKPDGYKDYECPVLAVDQDALNFMGQITTPLSMAVALLQNEYANTLVEAIKVFFNAAINLQAIILGYPGSVFCTGLLFGIHGSKLLINIGKTVTKRMDSITIIDSPQN